MSEKKADDVFHVQEAELLVEEQRRGPGGWLAGLSLSHNSFNSTAPRRCRRDFYFFCKYKTHAHGKNKSSAITSFARITLLFCPLGAADSRGERRSALASTVKCEVFNPGGRVEAGPKEEGGLSKFP